MPISGLVVTLCSSESPCRETLDALRAHEGIQLGPRQDDRLAIVLETPDSQADRQAWEWLQSLPGVVQVEIAVIHFDSDDSAEGEATGETAGETVSETTSDGRKFAVPRPSTIPESAIPGRISRGEQL